MLFIFLFFRFSNCLISRNDLLKLSKKLKYRGTVGKIHRYMYLNRFFFEKVIVLPFSELGSVSNFVYTLSKKFFFLRNGKYIIYFTNSRNYFQKYKEHFSYPSFETSLSSEIGIGEWQFFAKKVWLCMSWFRRRYKCFNLDPSKNPF